MKRLGQYGETSSKGKLIAICIKTSTALFVVACTAEGVDWKITLGGIIVGAIANEVINFYNWDKELEQEKKDTLTDAKELVEESSDE